MSVNRTFGVVSWVVWATLGAVAYGQGPEGAVSPGPSPASSSSAGRVHLIDEPIPGDPSDYSPAIADVASHWPPTWLTPLTSDPPNGAPIELLGFQRSDDVRYVAVEKQMIIHAPMARVEAIVGDVAHFQQLYPDFDSVTLASTDGNSYEVDWVKPRPVFFAAHTTYRIRFIKDSSHLGRILIRYGLVKAVNLIHVDGLLVLESLGPDRTRFTGFDLFQANFGPVKGLISVEGIWHNSMEGYFQSDVSVKLKAEHPDWTYAQIVDERQKLLKKYPVDPVQFAQTNPFLPALSMPKQASSPLPSESTPAPKNSQTK